MALSLDKLYKIMLINRRFIKGVVKLFTLLHRRQFQSEISGLRLILQSFRIQTLETCQSFRSLYLLSLKN
jgi:hypothetical protein